MKLDPRIKKDFIIFSPFAVDYAKEEVRKYINTKCYFCDDIIAYEGLENCDVGILAGFNYTECHPFIPVGDTEGYKFCLPAAFVEEKEKPKEDKYVPFETLNDLRDYKIRIGDPIVFFNKEYPEIRYSTIVTEIQFDNDNFTVINITLGSTAYSLESLCDNYIWHCCNNEWVPFGKRVEE